MINYNNAIYAIDFDALAKVTKEFAMDSNESTVVTEINECWERTSEDSNELVLVKKDVKQQLIANEINSKANMVLSTCLEIVFNELGLGSIGDDASLPSDDEDGDNEYSISFKIAFNTLLLNKIIKQIA